MFKSVTISNFRCFKEFHIDSLDRVNLIAGQNSVGKTALLEAIFLLIGAENLGLVIKISQFRGIKDLRGDLQSILELLWAPLFHKLQTDAKINVSGELDTGGRHCVEFFLTPVTTQKLSLNSETEPNLSDQILEQKYTDPSGNISSFEMKFVEGDLTVEPISSSPPFPGSFLTSRSGLLGPQEVDLFGRLIKSKRSYVQDLVKALKIVENRLEHLAIVPSGGSSMIYGDIGLDQMLPLSLLGDGIARFASILFRMANAPGGIVLIDEIENGLHHSIMRDVWRAIGEAAETFDTQVFATTHSYECIREAHGAFKESGDYGFRLHRLDGIDAKIKAVTFDQDMLETAIESFLDVR